MQKRRESRENPYTYIHMLRYPVGDFELDYQSVASGKPVPSLFRSCDLEGNLET
jgi:hypothetical protein